MGKGSHRSKQDRASRLLGLLRSDDHWTTMDLARELEISHRTLMRDLEELKDLGYPIETDRGRGGGVRLNGRWGIDRLNITNREAISLLLSLSITEALSPSGDHLGVRALKQKVANVFPESQRKSIIELRKKVLIGKTASLHITSGLVRTPKNVWEKIMESFFDSRSIELEYKDEKENMTSRRFDTHFLLLNWPVWYLLGWDYLREDVRVLRIDRIKAIQIRSEIIRKRSRAIFLESYEAYFQEI